MDPERWAGVVRSILSLYLDAGMAVPTFRPFSHVGRGRRDPPSWRHFVHIESYIERVAEARHIWHLARLRTAFEDHMG
jgi:hypothetical protein